MISKIKKHKKAIVIFAIIIVLAALVLGGFFKKNDNSSKIEKVVMGNVVQEVSETGTVKAVDELNLGFKTSGRIASVYSRVGDVVVAGSPIMALDKSQLITQLNQTQASLAAVQIQYSKLSPNAKSVAQQNLDSAYQDALNTLDDAYLKIYNAHSAADTVQTTYFSSSYQEGIIVKENKDRIKITLTTTKSLLDTAKISRSNSDIDSAVSTIIIGLTDTHDALKVIRETCDQGKYYSQVTSADKTILDNQRSYINTALTNTTNSQQTISSNKTALQKAEDDIDYYQAKVKEAQASVDSLQQQISDVTLRTPIAGTITKIDKQVGETVQSSETPVSLISKDPLQVKVDIYEEDVVKIQVNDVVNIKVAAFPNEVLSGKVISIDPAGKLVEGVIYYETTIAFDKQKEGLREGMTADVVIEGARKDNVLVISKEAVRENGKTSVLVKKGDKTEEKEITIGLEGSDGKVEVISGLSEGEEIIVK